jgi:cell wall assembly regulator SMI1
VEKIVASIVAESWTRINAWLQANGLPARYSPPPGVSETALRAAEAAMGLELPEDIRESYRLHDGSRRGSYLILFERGFLLQLAADSDSESVVEEWKSMCEIAEQLTAHYREDFAGDVAGPIRKTFWSPRWVPLTCDWESHAVCIDLDPAPGGRAGQVIMRRREADAWVLAPSWGEWLAMYAANLEAGEYRLRVWPDSDWVAGVLRASESDE